MLDRGYATWADRWEDTGRKKGLAPAKTLLKSILSHRFGPLPAESVTLIDNADIDKIWSWIEPAWKANSLAEALQLGS